MPAPTFSFFPKTRPSARALAVGALVALACAAPLAGAADAAPYRFNDADSDGWYVTEGWLDYVVDSGIMTGYSDGSNNFGTYDYITRGQVATVLYRIANPGSDATTNPDHYASSSRFSDVEGKLYYTAAIEWCAEQGIVTGYTDASGKSTGLFCPNNAVNRAELATMASRFAAAMGADMSYDSSAYFDTADYAFTEYQETYSYARSALKWTCDKGVLGGVQDNGKRYLDVKREAARAEAAKVFTVLKRDAVERSGAYTVTFKSNGGSSVATQTVTSGNKAQRAYPTRKGYTFVGWYSDEKLTREYRFDTAVTGSLTLYAKWETAASANENDVPDNDVELQDNATQPAEGTTTTEPAEPTAEDDATDTPDGTTGKDADKPAGDEPADNLQPDVTPDADADEPAAGSQPGEDADVTPGTAETPGTDDADGADDTAETTGAPAETAAVA